MTWKLFPSRRAGSAEHGGKRKKWLWAPAAAVVLCAAGFLFFVRDPAPVQAKENLMEGVIPAKTASADRPDADFIASQEDFSVGLLQKTYQAGKNVLVSPASVSLALGMTANGAQGGTLKEFEDVLGGGMNLDALNKNLAAEQAALHAAAEGKLQLANSIWYRDKNLTVFRPFLQANADYFGAGAFQLDFSNPETPKKINAWVEKNTDGKIKNMLEKIDSSTVMYLINTLYLEQDWQTPYSGSSDSVFHAPGGDRNVKVMHSMETYLQGEGAKGILKPLKDPRYAFAAILPDEGALSDYPNAGALLGDYVSGLTGKKLLSLLRSAGDERASASLPKFKFDCSVSLKDTLKSMGLSDAFDGNKADFSAMGTSPDGNLFIGDVLHKTFIEVDELGIKAGAATSVGMDTSSAPSRYVVFDRPFLFAVVDTQTFLPVFLGTVEDPGTADS